MEESDPPGCPLWEFWSMEMTVWRQDLAKICRKES